MPASRKNAFERVPKVQGKILDSTLRKQKMLELRIKGYSYPKIAAILGDTTRNVCQHVTNVLKEAHKDLREKGEELLELELTRIDSMYRMLAQQAFTPRFKVIEDPKKPGKVLRRERVLDEDGEPAYLVNHLLVQRMISLMERRAKLTGIDAPVVVKTDAEEAAREIQEALKQMREATGGQE